MGKIYTSKIITIAMFVLPSIAIAAPKATMDDYDWVLMDSATESTLYNYNCNEDYDYKTFNESQDCFYNLLEDADNERSRQWEISDKVVREKNAIYIKVPNRKNPLVFVDYSNPYEGDYRAYYSLHDYDKTRQLLTIHQSLYESETLTIVNLATGFWQDFYLRKLSVSPNMKFIAGFESEPGITQEISIWELQEGGYYSGYYKRVYSSETDADAFRARKDFYQVKEVQVVYDAETITWVNDSEFHADHFYKLNKSDSAAFRVRYTFKQDLITGEWQLLERDS